MITVETTCKELEPQAKAITEIFAQFKVNKDNFNLILLASKEFLKEPPLIPVDIQEGTYQLNLDPDGNSLEGVFTLVTMLLYKSIRDAPYEANYVESNKEASDKKLRNELIVKKTERLVIFVEYFMSLQALGRLFTRKSKQINKVYDLLNTVEASSLSDREVKILELVAPPKKA